ncbi:unnamed protein product [Effrenium voratum]|nr:unnamed protein product [Effrenium voratum]
MGQWAQEAVLRFRNAKRDLEYDRTNAALDEATQAYAAFQVAADAEGMAECVRIVCHAMARQGLRKQAIQMATEELEKFREQSKKRAEALMLLTLAEIKLNASAKETREEAAQLANQAKSAFQTMKDRRMEGESCLANGNALLKLEGTAGPAAEAFEHARSTFRSLQSLQLEGRALHGLACCRAKGGRFDQAVQRGNEALDCFVECRNECLEAAELEAISSWQLELGDSQSALKSAEQSLVLAEACSPRRQALALRALVRAYIAQGKAGLVLGNCVEAVSKFQEANAREAESIGLLALVECSIAAEDTLDRTMQAATDACLAFRELGDAQQEMQMLCTMSRQCLRRRQLDQAEDHARTALHIAQAVDDRALRAESVGLLADVFLAKPNSDKALAILKQEQAINRNDRDALGQALCLLSMANVHMEKLSKPKEVLACAEEARALFRSMGDKMGELSALQITADVHARAMRYSDMLATLEKALQLATGVGDTVTEASLNVSIAQATMGLMEVGQDAPDSPAFKELASKAAQVAKKAVGWARRQQRTDLVCSALCALSQSQFLGGEKEAARQAASTAANLARNAGDRLAEATALVLSANTYLALGKGEAAKQASSKALYVFEEGFETTLARTWQRRPWML